MKIFPVLIIAYLFVCMGIHRWETFLPDQEIISLSFEEQELGSFETQYWNYPEKFKPIDTQYGWIFVDRARMMDTSSIPQSIKMNQDYVLILEKLQAHSWLDFFMFGSKYDYELVNFAPGQDKEYDAQRLLNQTIEDQSESWLEFLSAILVLLFLGGIYWATDRFVYKRIPLKSGNYVIDKPLMLELLSAFTYALMAFVFLSVAMDYYKNDQWVGPLLFAFFAIALFYAAFKELKHRNCVIIMNAQTFTFEDGQTVNTFSIDELEKIELQLMYDDEGKKDNLFILFYSKAEAKPIFEFDLKEMSNLIRFQDKLEALMRSLYVSKIVDAPNDEESAQSS